MKAHLILLTVVWVAMAGCGKQKKPLPGDDDAMPAPSGIGGGDDRGPTESIGTIAVGSRNVEVFASPGPSAGQEWGLELRLIPSVPAPKGVQSWIGSEDAAGSDKAKGELEIDDPSRWAVDVRAPKRIGAGAKLWIEIQEKNDSAKNSIALPGQR